MASHPPLAVAIDNLPGFRRQIRITPGAGQCSAALHDDFHEMVATITHDGQAITGVATQTLRSPFTICPGAESVTRRTFVGLPLARPLASAAKPVNCIHLYDLTVLAANHSQDQAPLVYDVLISDALPDGCELAEIRRDGAVVCGWRMRDGVVVAPDALAGVPVLSLRGWIASLPADQAEAARILQGCTIVAGARKIEAVTAEHTGPLALSCYAHGGEGGAAPLQHTGNGIDFSAEGIMPQARRG